MIRLLRCLSATPPLRRLLTHPRVEGLIATFLRGLLVRESASFVARELAQRAVLARYRLRGSGLRLYVRHGTPDVLALDEVHYQRQYDLPPAVAAALDSLGRPLEVVDLGANIGLFGVFILGRFPDARITAFEPDRWNLEILDRCVRANGRADTWRVVRAAASNGEGELPFLTGRFALSQVAGEESPDTERVPAIDVLPYLARADLLKMDIEGGEWAILGDPRLAGLPLTALVLEYHPHLCPGRDPGETATGLLREAGYECLPIFYGREGHGMLWAWRPPPTETSPRPAVSAPGWS